MSVAIPDIKGQAVGIYITKLLAFVEGLLSMAFDIVGSNTSYNRVTPSCAMYSTLAVSWRTIC